MIWLVGQHWDKTCTISQLRYSWIVKYNDLFHISKNQSLLMFTMPRLLKLPKRQIYAVNDQVYHYYKCENCNNNIFKLGQILNGSGNYTSNCELKLNFYSMSKINFWGAFCQMINRGQKKTLKKHTVTLLIKIEQYIVVYPLYELSKIWIKW